MPKIADEKLGKTLTFQGDSKINAWLREQMQKKDRSMGYIIRDIIHKFMEADKLNNGIASDRS